MNPDGAMFCSNCSSILRSRRSAAPAKTPEAKPSVPSFAEEATRRIPVTNTVTPDAEPAEKEMPAWEEKYSAPQKSSPTKRAAAIKEPRPSRQRASYYDDSYSDEDTSDTVKFCSAWCNVLSVVSWVIFLAMMAIGIAGGTLLILMGLKDDASILYFGGVVIMILFVIMALAYHARNMVQIKILRKFNEKKK